MRVWQGGGMGGGCTVVVCCRDRPEQLRRSLPAVSAALRPEDELIVVDSGSRSAEVAVVAVESGARVYRLDRPGASRARNAGWAAAEREIVAFTDDDCLPEPGWLAALEPAFDDPAVGFAYGAVLPDGDGPPLSVTPPGAGPAEIPAGGVRLVDRFGHGANLAVRRAALQAVGGWDELIGAGTRLPGGEDADLALRLLRAGWTGRFVPGAAVRHPAWRSRGAALRTEWGYGLGAGAVAARARRADGDWWLLRHSIGPRGLGQVGRDLRAGYQYGAVAGLIRVAGTLTGTLLSLRSTNSALSGPQSNDFVDLNERGRGI